MSGLLDWSERRFQAEIRLLTAIHLTDGEAPTEADMKQWTREFIQKIVPTWRPGWVLSEADAQRVGAAFALALERAQRQRDPLGWISRL